MEALEWITRCSARLAQQWPRANAADLDDTALDLWQEARWREQEPEAAALAWLRQGIPHVA